MSDHRATEGRHNLLLSTCVLATALLGCDADQPRFARVFEITSLAQTIGGPSAGGRPGDFLLENDRIRAVIHGRHNARSSFPIGNGSLIDLDLQRPPQQRYRAAGGRDVFYEMGSMVDLKLNSSRTMTHGPCDAVGAAPCPTRDGQPIAGCERLSASGPGENVLGFLGLLDLALKREYTGQDRALEIITDYDICPGEALVRTTTTARFGPAGEPLAMTPLADEAGLLSLLLGDFFDIDCADADCPSGSSCVDLLAPAAAAVLEGGMQRCRTPDQALTGPVGGDFLLFSGKASVFIPGGGFDHESTIRDTFDTGGDVFSDPLTLDWVGAVGDQVSYVYFSEGKAAIPIFADSFTVALTHRTACPSSEPRCLDGKELRFARYVGVGQGDIASALASYYRLKGITTGRVEGFVLDPRRAPVSGAEILAFRVPADWEALDDGALARRSYDELVAAHRAAAGPGAAGADIGIVSHFRSDVGLDLHHDGSFGGPLPPGRYLLVARTAEHPPSAPAPIRIAADGTSRTVIIVGEPGLLRYDVRDGAGRPLPAKLTIGHCFPECASDLDCSADRPYCDPESQLCTPLADGGYRSLDDCRPDQTWDPQSGRCSCTAEGRLPLEFGGRRYADGTVLARLTTDGQGTLRLPPGSYQLIVSRGLEYEIARRFVTVRPAVATRLRATLPRVVDTAGWISADFHVHGPNSVDSGLDTDSRATSYAAEGVELLSSSDHDYLTDYEPTIRDLGLRAWLTSQIGVEISPLDYGHFLGFPLGLARDLAQPEGAPRLGFDENAELNGIFPWRVPLDTADNPDWENLPPGEIYAGLRALGAFGPEQTVIAIAHYYDNFDYYDVDPWSLEVPSLNLMSLTNPVLSSKNFSPDFDAVELFTAKNQDLIRRPTYHEVRQYNRALEQLLATIGGLDRVQRQRALSALSNASLHDFLVRSAEEQARAIDFDNPDLSCRCSTDAECGTDICDLRTGSCIAGCADDSACDAALVAAGRERCLPLPEAATETQRRTCQRIVPSCTRAADCQVLWKERAESCIAVDPTLPDQLSCELPCNRNSDCSGDRIRDRCVEGRCQQPEVVAATDADPCPTVRGTLDDWFQMLNHGVRRTALGNSDSHDLYAVEAGLPRNYVRSSADQPLAIGRLEVARNVKAGRVLPTYGPFVELTVDGQSLGATVPVPAGNAVALRIRVQSPRWFDVDRLEVYRNGQLWQAIAGRPDCAAGAADCIKVPNDTVVNYDQTLRDTPERDSWYVVVAMGVEGKGLAPVYSTPPVSRLGIFEVIQRMIPLLPPLRSLRIPLTPTVGQVRPYAVTNPIWVDVGGDGLTPLEAPPTWAESVSSSAAALAQPSAGHAHGDDHHFHLDPSTLDRFSHDHRRGLGRLRQQADALREEIAAGRLDPRLLRRALDALRHLH